MASEQFELDYEFHLTNPDEVYRVVDYGTADEVGNGRPRGMGAMRDHYIVRTPSGDTIRVGHVFIEEEGTPVTRGGRP